MTTAKTIITGDNNARPSHDEEWLTGRNVPRTKDRFQNVLCDLVGDEMEVKMILTIEQDALNKGHDLPRRIVLCTNDGNVQDLQRPHTHTQTLI